MTTQEILAQLQYDASGWPVEGARGLRHYLNECHRFMMSQDCQQNIVIDASTGKPPTINTTKRTHRYNAPAACRRIFMIGVDSYDTAASAFLYNYYNQNRNVNNLRQKQFSDWNYLVIPARTVDARPNNVRATYTFTYDPQTTTDIYHLFYYEKPVEILSDSIQPQVQDQFHDLLIDGVLARIGKKEYGSDDNYRYWREMIVKREYNKEMNKGWQTPKQFVTPRVC